ncbi:MAG TPA: ABATE domain-containing protein [Polyangiaceae bacterium]|nr:ABATE domain-containing protein [Polyangiaceae bacterium]
MVGSRHEHRHVFDFLAGRLAIDFVNTVSGKRQLAPIERLNDYGDVLSWAEQIGIASAARTKALRRIAREHPRQAEAALARAKELRESLFRIFSAVAAHEPASSADLELLNRELTEAFSHLRLAESPDGFAWSFSDDESLVSVLWPVTRSAADVLMKDDPARVRRCEAPDGCGWLFYDETRNATRRWCSMKDCGNRAKARRHYAKSKETD